MKRNVEAPGNELSLYRVMCLPTNLGVEVIAVGIEMPASNANDSILGGRVDNLHVANCRIAAEATSLFIEVESQPGLRFFSRLHHTANWCWRPYEVIAWRVRGSMRHQLIKILKL